MSENMIQITELIAAHENGDETAYDKAIEIAYRELHNIAKKSRRRMGGNATLQTTAIVNEAYVKMQASRKTAKNSAHFLNIAAKAMRQIIIDYARQKKAEKRGNNAVHVQIDDSDAVVNAQADQILLIDDALNKLGAHNSRLARVFELKFFNGLDDKELAHALNLSKRTAQRDWMKARAFIGEYLESGV